MKKRVHIGCAGWSVPAGAAEAFPREGSHLERYAARFDCVEINSTFYRPHLVATYERWAASVPARFRFSVKMPRAITHDARLIGAGPLVRKFLAEAGHLGSKLGCVLVQLPPSLAFDRAIAKRFLQMMRRHYDGSLALEPRHASWFGPAADAVLAELSTCRVQADPAIAVGEPAQRGIAYFRYHGSPRTYYSSYSTERLQDLAVRIAAGPGEVWCIFDNTALGAATPNALALRELIEASSAS